MLLGCTLNKVFSASLTADQICDSKNDEVFERLETGLHGLSSEESERRLRHYGLNEIQEKKSPLIREFLSNFTHLMALLLWVAAFFAFLAGMPQLAYAIVGVIMMNASFSFWQEYKAERAVEELRKLLPSYSKVIRDGEEKSILSSDVVPGDLLVLSEGDKVPADARLVRSFDLRVDSSILTGESKPVRKTSEPFSKVGLDKTDFPNILYAGTSIVSGSGFAVAYAISYDTEFGKIAKLTQRVESEPSPLQNELKDVTVKVMILAVIIGIVFFTLSVMLVGVSLFDGFIFAIGIIVAFVPEGLLPTVTLALAMGMQRMAKRHALVKKLSSVEALGCTTVICTDKTGTLTCNEMTATNVWVHNNDFNVSGVGYEPVGGFTLGNSPVSPVEDSGLMSLLFVASVCNNAQIIPPSDENPKWGIMGDPTEGAILVAALKAGSDYLMPRLSRLSRHEIPFDSRRKRMTVIIPAAENPIIPKQRSKINYRLACVKGSPVELLDLCTHILKMGKVEPLGEEEKKLILNQIDEYAKDALRVLGLAYRYIPPKERELIPEDVEEELTFIGLIGLIDPPRPEVKEAVEKCHRAGIRIIMITGDYGLTAEVIARKIGITKGPEVTIVNGQDIDSMSDQELAHLLESEGILFSRVSPEHKLRIVSVLKEDGEIVAVTGDGVNDAPALKTAAVGIAMGMSGTDIAKEASDVILTDNNFATIVAAIEEGRAVFSNIRKFIEYIFTSNVAEALPFILYVLLKLPLPLQIMQVLLIDLGTDMVPGMALGAEPPEPGIMDLPPRSRRERLMNTKLLVHSLLFLGLIEAFAGLFGYFWSNYLSGWRPGLELAQPGTSAYVLATTMTLVGIVMTQVGNVIACKTDHLSILKVDLLANRLIFVGLAVEFSIILLVVNVPFFNGIFGTTPLGGWEWGTLLLFAPFILILEELRKYIANRRSRA